MQLLKEIQPFVGLFALGAMSLAFVVALTWKSACDAWTRARPFSRFVFFMGVAGITLYGGSKQYVGTVTFPLVDAETRYITNAGSYVTNDHLHVAYTLAVGVPSSAPIVVERRVLGSTNEMDWVCVTNVAARNFTSPQDIWIAAATNYNWIVYTTYTPGAAVVTNGVWHCWWGLDQKSHAEILPVRTCVRVDGEVIATPESVRKAEE